MCEGKIVDKRYFKNIERLFQLLRSSLESRHPDCIDGLCPIKEQKTYTVLSKGKFPRVFTFNLAWTSDPQIEV